MDATFDTTAEPAGKSYDDMEYMTGGLSFHSDSSLLRSTSKYLNSPLIRDLYTNEGLRRCGPDAPSTAILGEGSMAYHAVRDMERMAWLIREEAERLPEFRAFLDARHSGNITYEQTAACAPGTLGHAIKLLLDRGFGLYGPGERAAMSDWDYILQRRGETHEIEHILTGFPTPTMAGEIGLYLMNITSFHAYFRPELSKEIALYISHLWSTWTMRCVLHHPRVMPAVCDAMEKGSVVGKRISRPLFMERWEDYLDWPLTKLRAQFNIPEPGGFVGDWTWEEDAHGAASPIAANTNDCSILRSTSKYLNSPLIRELFCNEGLRVSGADITATSLVTETNDALEAVQDHKHVAWLLREEAKRIPEFGEWLDARYSGDITYEQAAACAPGTLGHEIRLLLDKGFKLYFGRIGPAESDWEYIRKRRGQLHDIEHIVTGFQGTCLAGEIGNFMVNATSIHAYFRPELSKEIALYLSFLLTTWTMRAALHHPEAMPALCDAMEKGSITGKQIRRPLFMERWEDYLDWPLPKLRAHFNIPEPVGFVGDWNWVEQGDRAPALAAE
jgi:ubiquinone biosynthesis protein COQ4